MRSQGRGSGFIPIIVLLGGLLLSSDLFAQNLNFKRYGNEDGLPQVQVYSIFQDDKGYIWIGTLGGVARYNGYRWDAFTKSDGLIRNEIKVISQDSDGNLLLGTRGGMNIFKDNRFTVYQNDGLLSHAEVNDIIEGVQKRTWIGTREGLVLLSGGEAREFTAADGLPHDNCRTLLERSDGTLWIATDQGVVWFDGSVFHAVPPGAAGHLNDVNNILQDDQGRIFFSTDRGLFFKKDGAVRAFMVNGKPVEDKISDGARDFSDGLWFVTVGNGVIKIKNNQVTRVTTRNGLAHDHVLCVLTDRENNVWFGTDDGLSKLTEGSFVAFRTTHGLTNDFIRALFEDKEGRLWVGTRDGVSTRVNNRFQTIIDTKRLVEPAVYSIGQHPDGRMLFATLGGLTTYKDGVYETFDTAKGMPVPNLKAVFSDSTGKVWLGGDGLAVWENKRFQTFPDYDFVGEAQVLDITEDLNGNIWVATRNQGLLSYDRASGSFKQFKDQFDVVIWCLDVDTAGAVWIGTNGLGLFKYNGSSFTRYTTEEGLGHNTIWQVLCASNGNVWIGHNKGLDQLKGNEFRHFNKSDGLADNEAAATACWEDRRHFLWFGAGKGLTQYLPGEEHKFKTPPLVHVESVVVGNGKYSFSEGDSGSVELPHDRSIMTFSFAGLSFRNETGVRYRFRLAPYEPDWSPVTDRREHSYGSLGRGDYRFMVMAQSDEGIWSEEPAVFNFTILPAFYETWWFRMLAALLVFGMVVGYHRTKMIRIKRHNSLLEGLVLERTEELAMKNEELKQLSLSDSLTKLRNRRYLTEIMPGELKGLQRKFYNAAHQHNPDLTNYNIGFILIDMDHFKTINDSHGHEAGDMVLVQLANVFMETLRSSDIIVRWGGEEFLVLLRELKRGHLGFMANRILEKVRATEFEIGGGKTLFGTCSAGYAYFPVHVGSTFSHWEAIIKLADTALYTAKSEGRDRACGLGYDPNISREQLEQYLAGDINQGISKGVFRYLHEHEEPRG